MKYFPVNTFVGILKGIMYCSVWAAAKSVEVLVVMYEFVGIQGKLIPIDTSRIGTSAMFWIWITIELGAPETSELYLNFQSTSNGDCAPTGCTTRTRTRKMIRSNEVKENEVLRTPLISFIIEKPSKTSVEDCVWPARLEVLFVFLLFYLLWFFICRLLTLRPGRGRFGFSVFVHNSADAAAFQE